MTERNTDNTLPANELELRRRVLAATEDLADLMNDAGERILELHDLGVPAAEWLDLVVRHAPPMLRTIYDRFGGFVGGAIDGYIDARKANAQTGTDGAMAAIAGMLGREVRGAARGDLASPPSVTMPEDLSGEEYFGFETLRMKRLIARLFAEAPKLTDSAGNPDTTQAPALQCHVMLKAGGSIQGALSITPEGTLRMMSPNEIGPQRKPVMIEHFFDIEQVADIAVFREVTASAGSGIITS